MMLKLLGWFGMVVVGSWTVMGLSVLYDRWAYGAGGTEDRGSALATQPPVVALTPIGPQRMGGAS